MTNLLMILLGGAMIAESKTDAQRTFGAVILGTGLSKSLDAFESR